ncbi:MAG: N-acetylmuramoyl-L-alanine amidase [Armatimonadetes bacterium]|nr:N-acetylmuramoyl-L-alanine amidase [Armatimonadota bacterium]
MSRQSGAWCVLIAVFIWLAVANVPARAEIGPMGTRISIDGRKPRGYQIYGYPEDKEIYAPVARELGRFDVEFRIAGNTVRVLRAGRILATWPIVTEPEQINDDADPPQVLYLGSAYYVPLRAAARLLGLTVSWDKQINLTSVRRAPQEAGQPAPAVPTAPPSSPAALARLASPSLAIHDDTVEVCVQASSPVAVTTFRLSHPFRIVFDFQGAIWQEGAPPPAPTGPVLRVRMGQFHGSVARLVLEVVDLEFRCLALPLAPTREVIARVGKGEVAAGVVEQLPPPEAPQTPARQPIAVRPRRHLAARGDLPFRRTPVIIPPGAPLAHKVICVDAGHGGENAGARGPTGLMEKDVNLAIALDLAELLQEAGATVILPRIDDTFVSLDDRIAFANSNNADLFISIHCNAMPRAGTASGTETYYYTPQSLGLVQAIHPEVVRVVNDQDRGIKQRGFAVIRRTQMPSVLVEVAFIDHPGNEAKLAEPAFRREVAKGIHRGVLRYFGQN